MSKREIRREQILEEKVLKLPEYLSEDKTMTFSKNERNYFAMLVREDRMPI
jgi:hypothetical protein